MYYLKIDVNAVSPTPSPSLTKRHPPKINLLHLSLPPCLPIDRALDMEGGQNKGTKASSSEASSPEPTTDDPKTMRRNYECVFCKRGFTTAQALGGHMNLHRKERDRMQHGLMVSSVSGKVEENLEGYGYNMPYSYHHRTYSLTSESLKNHSFCFPASSSGGRDSRVARDHDDMGSRRQSELSLFGKHLHPGLGMHFDGSSGVYEQEKRNCVDGEEELDLELRLGHQP